MVRNLTIKPLLSSDINFSLFLSEKIISVKNMYNPIMDKEEPEIKVNAPAEKLYVLENPDKEGWHEQWHSERHLANIPHPFRAILYGKPNSGKALSPNN